MTLEITATPRETLVCAPTPQGAAQLRRELADSGFLVLDADPWDLQELNLIPEGEHHEFDPSRIFDVGIGADANATLQALVDSGHSLIWHRWQTRLARKVWGVSVKIPPRGRRRSSPSASESAVHFGIPVRSTRGLALRMNRETYAGINKRSSIHFPREVAPKLWDATADRYEDAEHRLYTDDWCTKLQEMALHNYDLNMAHFASLDPVEFEDALQRAVKGRKGMVELTDLTKWDNVPGLYVMVLDEYRQVYIGATDASVGVLKRIKQHWTGTKQFDRLILTDPETSIISIDSFRALDTTRTFAVKTTAAFVSEDALLNRIRSKFRLNRISGGRDAVRLAAIVGVDQVIKRREFIPAVSTDQEPSA